MHTFFLKENPTSTYILALPFALLASGCSFEKTNAESHYVSVDCSNGTSAKVAVTPKKVDFAPKQYCGNDPLKWVGVETLQKQKHYFPRPAEHRFTIYRVQDNVILNIYPADSLSENNAVKRYERIKNILVVASHKETAPPVQQGFQFITPQATTRIPISEIKDSSLKERQNRNRFLCEFARSHGGKTGSLIAVHGEAGLIHRVALEEHCTGHTGPLLQVSRKGELRLKVDGESVVRVVTAIELQ